MNLKIDPKCPCGCEITLGQRVHVVARLKRIKTYILNNAQVANTCEASNYAAALDIERARIRVQSMKTGNHTSR